MGRAGFACLEIGTAYLLTLAELPMHHRDPFDHLLIAQAIAEDLVFLSADRDTARDQLRFVTWADAPSPPVRR